jgi:Holliday junction resolvase RusA-like endonuclease
MENKHCTINNTFSANQMYVPVRRGVMCKSAKYNDWIKENVDIVRQMKKPEQYPIHIDILILADSKWKQRHDTDNCIKPLVDLLVKAGVIPDDSTRYIESIQARHLMGFGKPVVTISYTEIN